MVEDSQDHGGVGFAFFSLVQYSQEGGLSVGSTLFSLVALSRFWLARK
jgi:hypothetical protein